MRNRLSISILIFIISIGIQAQTHTDQNGVKTSVISGLSAPATQAKRYKIASVSFNSMHWSSSGSMIIEFFAQNHRSGYEKFIVEIGHNQGTLSTQPLVKLVESEGALHNAQIFLSPKVDIGQDPHDSNTRLEKIDIYVDIKYYSGYKVRITHVRNKVNTLNNRDQIVIYDTPTSTDIPDFSSPILSPKVYSDLTVSQNLDVNGQYFLNGTSVINHDVSYRWLSDANGKARIYFGHGDQNNYYDIGAVGLAHHFRSSTNGNLVSIRDNPNSTLEVNGITRLNDNILYFGSNTGSYAQAIGQELYFGNNGQYRLAFQNDGDLIMRNHLAIGQGGNYTYSSSHALDVTGTSRFSEKLVVENEIESTRVKVTQTPGGWPDYVFTPTYKLKTLNELEKYIQTNGHLPNIPSATEIEESGQDLGAIQAKLLEKIEELTLYTIDQEKKLEEVQSLKEENKTLKAQLKLLLGRIEKLELRNKK